MRPPWWLVKHPHRKTSAPASLCCSTRRPLPDLTLARVLQLVASSSGPSYCRIARKSLQDSNSNGACTSAACGEACSDLRRAPQLHNDRMLAGSAQVHRTGAGPELRQHSRPACTESRLCPPGVVDDLRYDDDFAQLGAFAGIGPRAGGDAGMRRHSSRTRSIGRARGMLRRFRMVREELMEGLERELIENVEVHYVRYPEGGYFQRHVDDYEDNDGAPSRRSVSFICYLNDPGAPSGRSATAARCESILTALLRDPAGRGVARPL